MKRALALLALAGCDLGLDPSMVDAEGQGGAAQTASSATGRGGDDQTANSASSTSSSASQGGGGAGGSNEGGAGGGASTTTGAGGGGGGVTFTPCAAPDDFEDLDLGDDTDAWEPTGSVSTVGANDRVRMVASVPSPQMQQVTPSLLEACFTSMRVDQEGGAILYLSIDCAPGRMEFSVDQGQQSTVEITDAPVATPEPAPAGAPFNLNEATLRVRFEGVGGNVVFEVQTQGNSFYSPLITMPQPAWADSCVVGFGANSIASAAEVDDFCVDAP